MILNLKENEEVILNFLDISKKILNYQAPCEQKYAHAQGNYLPIMNKTLPKEIMRRTRLRNSSKIEMMTIEESNQNSQTTEFF